MSTTGVPAISSAAAATAANTLSKNDVHETVASLARQTGTAKNDPAPAIASSATITLSQAAQWITALLGQKSAASLRPTLPPLLAAPANDAPALAQAMQQTISQSGLFYESHLGQWLKNSHLLENLQQEPQNKVFKDHSIQDNLNQSDLLKNRLNEIVRSQLDLLDSGTIRCETSLWPGTPLQLSIQKEMPEKTGTPDQPDLWKSTISVEFPALGKITAQCDLRGDQVRFTLRASDPVSIERLRTASPLLADSLQASGLQLDGFSAHSHEAD